jgi:L-lactate dehydrogenase complex protein LldG
VSKAREAVLARIRAAGRGAVEPREERYRKQGSADATAVVALFVERVEEYGARVVPAPDLVAALGELLAGKRIAIDPLLHDALRPVGVELVVDEGLSAAALDGLDGALTTCGVACAETGTVALTGGPGEGRRALSLVPDLHVCVVRREQIVETVLELIARLEPAARAGRPLVLVSGPSATSDIELERVEGVHGPRTLVIVLTD